MPSMRPRRSALYMPGANARALEKARSLPADVLVLDLEDAVAPEAKASAREQIAAAIAAGFPKREVAIRTNGIGTDWFAADAALVATAKPDAALIPKVGSAADVAAARAGLAKAGAPAGTQLWAMIETPIAILNLPEIAASAPDERYPLGCFIVGTNDLVKETRAELDGARTAALYWLSAIVTAARAYGIDVLDGVYNNFKDMDGYERECRHGRMLGMDGKTLIHPGQIELANRIFAPDADEVAWGRRIIAAFEEPENRNKGVINIDGRMVELLHAEMAKRTVALADVIAEKESV